MAMSIEQAQRRLMRGYSQITKSQPQRDRERRYMDGDHDLPFAPPGVSQEYKQIRKIASSNLLPLIIGAPLQRLRVDGYRRHGNTDDKQDLAFWSDTWQFNRMDLRQKVVFADAMHHGRGVLSVSKRSKNKKRPRISVESPNRVHLEMDPDDPFKPLYAAKVVKDESEMSDGPGIQLVNGGIYGGQAKYRGFVYDHDSWHAFTSSNPGNPKGWAHVGAGKHDLQAVPFVPVDCNLDSDGVPHSPLAQLIPAQDAINFVRFATLMAMQFSAHRHRAVTGFDPVIYDPVTKEPIFRTNADGSLMTDPQTGLAIPVTVDLGRAGMDQMIAFRDPNARIWDLPESNMGNYVAVYDSMVSDLFARGQVPPHYQLTSMHNLTGDAITGAESTLAALVDDLQTSFGESIEQTMRLAGVARGDNVDDMASEVEWGDGETKSFAQTVDGITKLIATGFPRQAAFSMLPGATKQKVDHWMQQAEQEMAQTYDLMEKREQEILANAA